MDEKHTVGKPTFAMRDFRIEDYDQVIKLWSACGLPFRVDGRDSRERIANEIAKPMAIFLVAECQGSIVGTLLGTTDGRKGWINRLAVHPLHQRSRLGTKMIEEMESRFSKMGLEVIACLIEDHNQGSMAFFAELGYKDDPTVHYYSKRRRERS
jgi:ribosomal protein S18 acetylase RimI-like enzyme